jgi:hypothetical protein
VQGVFQSAGQALFVAFLMEVLPVTQQTSTQILIDGLRKRCGVWDDQRAPSTINFGGLSPLEVRGQCALVRATVEDHLPGPERDAIWARFGHNGGSKDKSKDKDKDGRRDNARMIYDEKLDVYGRKSIGIARLCEYLQPLTGVDHTQSLRAVAYSLYQPGTLREQDKITLADITRQWGVPRHKLQRAAQVVRNMAQGLERRADERLVELFERTGLVMAEERDVQSA